MLPTGAAGFTRARVTQLLALNRIPLDAVQRIRHKMASGKRPLSIRMLLRFAVEAPVT